MTVSPSAPRMPRSDRRAQLLKAAAELFGERGYATTSIDSIGERAGVTGPAVYRHFSGKRDLLLTLLTGAVDSALADIRAAMRPDATPRENLEALVRELVRHAIAERQMIGLLYAQTGSIAGADRQRIEALRGRVLQSWLTALTATRPELDAAVTTLYVQAALSTISGIARSAPETADEDVVALYSRMMIGMLTA